MPAVIPTKPTSGGPVASTWGIDVHSRMYTPLASVVSGNLMTGLLGAEVALSIDTHLAGANMLDTALDRLIIPVGGSGLYLVMADLQVSGLGLGNDARARMTLSGTPQNTAGEIVGMGAGLSSWLGLSGIFLLSDGQGMGVNVLPHATDAADYQLRRMTLIRIGNAYGATISGLSIPGDDGNVAADPDAL